jgi:hypothetical protein
VVQLHIYNMLPDSLNTVAKKLAAAERKLPRGTHLAIVEPFFKMMADGDFGVRVDDPQEVGAERVLPMHPVRSGAPAL